MFSAFSTLLTAVLIVLPVFGMIVIGYATVRLNILTEATGTGLSRFIFNLAMPLLMFRTLVHAEFPAVQPWGYWMSYFAGVFIAWFAAMFLAATLFRQNRIASAVAGFCAGQSNTLLMGVPMILQAYGREAEVPLFLLLAIHLPVVMTLGTLLAEGRNASWPMIVKRLIGHPIMIGIISGSVARPFADLLPDPLWHIINPLADAASPCALISMGIALHCYGIKAGWKIPALLTAFKLIIHPLVVYILAVHVFTMPPVWAGVAVLFAACPTGINAYVFAAQYDEGKGFASSTLTMTTGVSVFTMVMWLRILGV